MTVALLDIYDTGGPVGAADGVESVRQYRQIRRGRDAGARYRLCQCRMRPDCEIQDRGLHPLRWCQDVHPRRPGDRVWRVGKCSLWIDLFIGSYGW